MSKVYRMRQPLEISTKTPTHDYSVGMAGEISLFGRIIEPRTGSSSSEQARYVLSLDFTPEQQARYAHLSDRVQERQLTPEEDAELNEFISANALLTVLQSKARAFLKPHPGGVSE